MLAIGYCESNTNIADDLSNNIDLFFQLGSNNNSIQNTKIDRVGRE